MCIVPDYSKTYVFSNPDWVFELTFDLNQNVEQTKREGDQRESTDRYHGWTLLSEPFLVTFMTNKCNSKSFY